MTMGLTLKFATHVKVYIHIHVSCMVRMAIYTCGGTESLYYV